MRYFTKEYVGQTITFLYEGQTRKGVVNFVNEKVVNIFCEARQAYRSFSHGKIIPLF